MRYIETVKNFECLLFNMQDYVVEEVVILLGILIIGSMVYVIASFPFWATETVMPQYENSTPKTFRESLEQWRRNLLKWKEAVEENARRTRALFEWQRRMQMALEIDMILCGLAIILIAYKLRKMKFS